jgi:hypothetical protein
MIAVRMKRHVSLPARMSISLLVNFFVEAKKVTICEPDI